MKIVPPIVCENTKKIKETETFLIYEIIPVSKSAKFYDLEEIETKELQKKTFYSFLNRFEFHKKEVWETFWNDKDEISKR